MANIDYGSFKDANDASKRVDAGSDPRPMLQWWKAKEGVALSDAVFGQVYSIMQADKARIQQYNQHARSYGNQSNPINNTGFSITTVNANQSPVRDRIAFNLGQSCTDTLTSKISKNKPKPFFLTSKGNSKIQRKAKKLDAYCTGCFYENDAYHKMPTAFRDACVWGEGLIHVFGDHGRVKWERVLPYEILVDYLEAHPGPEFAKTMHRMKQIDRTTLAALFPKHEKVIEHMTNTSQMLSSSNRSVADTVTIVESWRLPSAPGAEDGLHCISAPGLNLICEPYKRMFFPFAVLRYSNRLHGYWGQGLIEQLSPIQTELNRCLMTVQRSFHLGGSFKVLLHSTSKVIKSHVDNTIGAIITWSGDHPPQYIVPPMVQPEIYQQIATLKQMGYEQCGISQLSAASNKPAGLNSGKALRETVDIETDRFQTVGQGYEAFALDLAKLSVAVATDIYEEYGDLSVKVPGKKFITSIDWSDVDLDEDEYVMQIFPVSKLPSTPEGRLETIQEMMQAGLIDQDTGRRLLDYPDLDDEENLANAQLDYIHDMLDGIVEDGKPSVFEAGYFNPTTALKIALEYYAVGRRDNLEEEKMELIRRFIQSVNSAQQAAMPQPTPGAQPQAVPAAPPVSNLLPNAPGAAA